MKKIIIIGASGHGKVIADIAVQCGYEKILFLDDDPKIKECGGFPIVGTSRESIEYTEYDFIVGIGDARVRKRIQEQLESEGLHVITLIHPSAVVADSALIQSGTAVMAGAVINPGAKIGKGCIVNTCSSIDHDCVVSDYVHISVGAHIAGMVQIGVRTCVGAGATVSNNLSICGDCVIGAGAVVIKNIETRGTYIGVPARMMGTVKIDRGGYWLNHNQYTSILSGRSAA